MVEGESFAVDLEAVPWSDLPEKIVQLLPYGDVTTLDGRRLKVSDWSLQSILVKFHLRANQVVIDYEHGTFFPDVPLGGLAAGWIWDMYAHGPGEEPGEDVPEDVRKAFEAGGFGVYARVSFTKKAAEEIAARQWRYLSPYIMTDDNGEVVEIWNAGLTNDPAIDGMLPLAASRANVEPKGDTDDGRGTTSPDPNTPAGGNEMDWQALATQLGITASSEEEFRAKLAALKAANDQNAAELEKERGLRLQRDAEAAVDAAVKAGQIPDNEAMRSYWRDFAVKDPAAFKRYTDTAPKDAFAKEQPPKDPPKGRMSQSPDDGNTSAQHTGALVLTALPRQFGRVDEARLKEAEEAYQRAKKQANGDSAMALRRMSGAAALGAS